MAAKCRYRSFRRRFASPRRAALTTLRRHTGRRPPLTASIIAGRCRPSGPPARAPRPPPGDFVSSWSAGRRLRVKKRLMRCGTPPRVASRAAGAGDGHCAVSFVGSTGPPHLPESPTLIVSRLHKRWLCRCHRRGCDCRWLRRAPSRAAACLAPGRASAAH